MKGQRQVDWEAIRAKASTFSEQAFAFVQDGLSHTVKSVHGDVTRDPERQGASDERFHVTGQQLCLGLRELAIQRYGLLAKTVLHKWGVRKTDDFGTIVYAMIDRAELRSSDRDSIEDFAGVYDFDEAFEQACPR
ncbi:MAG TPA: hypothetical protein PL072_03875 [Phycisphaerales bacterium]|nr:hypothetical protein [Phycisphaerales bacterium]HPO92590.1 hypothetical protein [Phycisphaerales bacterium]